MVGEGVTIRSANAHDDGALADLDYRCWDARHEVSDRRERGTPFFRDLVESGNVLVAEVGGAVVGYVGVRAATTLPSNAHVQQIQGLLVDPAYRRRGVGRSLVEAAIELARSRRARKLSLRVLGSNPEAERLYVQAGFAREGVLAGEFLREGSYVDDVFMARQL
jgi:ribosomal protein S18 acetylase RimI-like enzyme